MNPKRYALVVGISMYSHPYENLEYPTHDAEQVARVLEQHGQFEVERLPKRLNPDTGRDEVVQKELTGDELGEALNQFLLEKAKGSDALIYYSGHGITVPNKVGRNKGYLVTSDCASGTVWRDGIALDDFNDLISEADLKSLVVLLDCCHAGYFLESNLIRQTLSIFSRKTDCFLIAACRSNEKSYEGGSYGGEHGVFTNALLEGLSQENAGYDGKIRTDELFSFISIKLELRNKNKPLKPQEAIRISSGCSLTLVSYPPKPTPPLPDDTCPYQGLQFFDKKQARFFFGRRKVIETLRQKLEQANFVPVIGASGSGKSSVVRAGLIPGLEENGWRVLNPILPGSEPLEKLKQAFSQLVEQPEDVQTIASLIDTAPNLKPVIDKLPDSERLLLVVDQFEEVFTVCPKEEERRRFIELLAQVAEIPDSRLAIVTMMRADFLEPCLSYPSLTQHLNQKVGVYLQSSLEGEDLERAITSPANLQGYQLETGLLGAILQDVGQEKGCLPLLQFALRELWEERDRQTHQLTLAKYHELGGVIGALERHAEQLYQNLTQQQQKWVKRIFLKLVRTGENGKDTRQRQPKSKLLAIAGDNSANREALSDALEKLIWGRLLVSDSEGEDWSDLAHEALMGAWKRFAQWRKEDRELRRLIDRVEDALYEWQKEPKDENLMMGGLLAQVRLQWVELETNPNLDFSAKEFYQRSEDFRQREELLRANEELLRAIIEDQTDLICRFKPDRTLTFVNDAYCRYFNKQPSELIGYSFIPVIPKEDQDVTQSISSLSIEQPIVTYEHRIILPSGEIRWHQWSDRALFDEQGNLIEFQAVGRDITDLKQAEAEIRKARKALEMERELSELRSGFVSLVSHEFRVPMTTIQLSAELLERYGNRLSEEKTHNHFRRIELALSRMKQLLDDVLTIGRAEAGKLKFEPKPMDVVAFCRDIVESIQISARPKHTINFVVEGDCTNAQMDEKLLGHIITNLLSNAIKYSPQGGTVQFALICNSSSAMFRIQDTGIGIPQEYLKQMFETFQRARNVGTIPGTGLGLVIVKKCVDLHGGEIIVESELGVGSTFTVMLPLNCQVERDSSGTAQYQYWWRQDHVFAPRW